MALRGGRSGVDPEAVAILYSDLAGASEAARTHHRLLAESAVTHGGEEVTWLGDGLVVTFATAADAVECAIALQRAARQTIDGHRLPIRIGLNLGQRHRESDHLGRPVIVARRLCDRAEAGQVLCTDLVAHPLARRFAFNGLGALHLEGIPEPVPAYELRAGWPGLPAAVPVVGRDDEQQRLLDRWTAAAAGRGGLVLVAGEAGIGKTRLVAELANGAARESATVLWGHCFESDWVPPYAPFVQVLQTMAARPNGDHLRVDLGDAAGAVAQLGPGLRRLLPEIMPAAPLQPDEERFRLFDAVVQLLVERSARTPLLLCLEDLQWADRGSIDLSRHLARLAAGNRLLVVGTVRDVDIDRSHPLARAFGALRAETDCEVVQLRGLSISAVDRFLAALVDRDLPDDVVKAVAAETEGNPFFMLELVRDLVEAGKVHRDSDGRWNWAQPAQEVALPRSVREVIADRLTRLSVDANRLLAAAAAFDGPFRLDVAGRLCGISEDRALDAVDETVAAGVLHAAEGIDVYTFTHRPIRQTVYASLTPSRRLRLHRRAAEALEQACGGAPSPAQAGQVAAQYRRSAGLPGAERGAGFAIAAAAHAESTGAYDDAAQFLRTALDLIPAGDARRPRLLGRLAVVLAWAATFDEAVEATTEAGAAIAAAEGAAAAAEVVSEAMASCLANADRLAALEATGLLDAPPRPELDGVTSQAAERLGVPFALITLVDNRRQFFASRYGLDPEVLEQVTPLEFSYCKFVAALDEPFRVTNSLNHVLVRDNPVAKLVRSYLGVPLRTSDGHTIGSLCVGDSSPRQWRTEDQEVLEELARQAMAVAERPDREDRP
jgi:GAF domain-containing protein